ncbi:MAG: DNA polymerase I, partial [Calditrichaeota bacterium]|nr:DNA polymerase I [Calditrichota bacterium]
FKPEQVIDVLGLMGDSSDNVPGVAGIGPKTATKLIEDFGSIEGIYEHIDEMKESKNKERLIEQKENALLSKRLVTIETNVPVEHDFEKMKPEMPDMQKVRSFIDELEFHTMMPRIETYIAKAGVSASVAHEVSQIKEQGKKRYIEVTTHRVFNELILTINKGVTAFSVIWNGKHALNSEIEGIAFSFHANEGYYLSFTDQFFLKNRESIIWLLRQYFENPDFKKVGHNLKLNALVLSQLNIRVSGMFFDTMVASYLLNPGARNVNLDDMSLKYLGHTMKALGQSQEKESQISMSFEQKSDDHTAQFSCEEVDITFQLYAYLKNQLEKEDLSELFDTIEMPLVATLTELEKNGVHLDLDFLKKMSNELAQSINSYQKQIYEIAGEEFNLNSPKQLGPILFEKLEIHKELGKRAPKKTKTGSYSTAEPELIKFEEHKIIDLILNYRELTKLKSTYVDALPELINPKTHAIHTTFNQVIAATGRLSSIDPNLQNIPIRTEMGRQIRKAFISGSDDFKILSADYSQIELRLVAIISNDEQMKDAFRQNLDIHTATAAAMFGYKLEDVTPDIRRRAKEINFGIIYGMSQWGLASRIHISDDEARSFIDSYFVQYPGVHNYMMNTVSEARMSGFVKTLSGRKRQIPEINSENRMIREGAERVAINTPIQGTAADLIKIAMINIQKAIDEQSLKSKMILQVHDELVFNVHVDEIELLKKLVVDKMENAMSFDIKLKVDVGVGDNWLEAH